METSTYWDLARTWLCQGLSTVWRRFPSCTKTLFTMYRIMCPHMQDRLWPRRLASLLRQLRQFGQNSWHVFTHGFIMRIWSIDPMCSSVFKWWVVFDVNNKSTGMTGSKELSITNAVLSSSWRYYWDYSCCMHIKAVTETRMLKSTQTFQGHLICLASAV
jgi:hypothetical protein